MTHERAAEIAQQTDIDGLWRELRQAKQVGDVQLVRVIENRMRALSQERRFAHLSDDELRARIQAVSGNREPQDLLAHSPGGDEGAWSGTEDTAALNRAITANQHAGIEATLGALLDELQRRTDVDDGDGSR